MASSWPEGKTCTFKIQTSPKAGKTKFYQFFMLYVHGFLVIQLVPRGKKTHFQVQTSPKAGKTKVYLFLCAIIW
ncbi:hypothetical protein H5410_056104 [Solanum commersonii]|uniref:Uncharacterized protein n=1 Tax=Solanum commersonii TaxID=4109 RepID=A0A9J5WKA7_SOLCO|nr:hypothetical protein H5410_056104 [Solanum commersonii]